MERRRDRDRQTKTILNEEIKGVTKRQTGDKRRDIKSSKKKHLFAYSEIL